jgi:hypothetical protein
MNLSWEYAASNPVTASERMNVFFSNGDVAFLDSSLCNKPIASSGGTWLRADFTGFTSGCSFSVVGETAGTYSATGTESAWHAYATQWPDQVVTIRHLLVDSGAAPVEGKARYLFDRISLSVGKMYTHGDQLHYGGFPLAAALRTTVGRGAPHAPPETSRLGAAPVDAR